MTFAAPMILYGLPLSSLPIVFYLLLRQKRQVWVFSSLLFFRRLDPQLHARRRLRQWLILLLRVLLIALVLTALARPRFRTVSAGAAASDPTAVVIVLDNSGSMSAPADAGHTRLSRAIEGAGRLLGDLPAALVTLVEDPAVESDGQLTRDHGRLLRRLDAISATQASGDAAAALTRALACLRDEPAGLIHVFSDMQNTEWLVSARPSRPADLSGMVYLHRIDGPKRRQANIAIADARPARQRILPGQPCGLEIALQNTSAHDGEFYLHVQDCWGQNQTRSLRLAKGQTRTELLDIQPRDAGHRWVKIRIEGDGFVADNEAGIGLACRDTVAVLFAGGPERYGVLPVALSPTGRGLLSGLRPIHARQEDLTEAIQQNEPVLVVMNWDSLAGFEAAQSESLRHYVEQGHNLLILPDPGRLTAGEASWDWLAASCRPRKVFPRSVALNVLDKRADLWRTFRDESGRVQWGYARLSGYFPLTLSREYTPLLGVDYQNVVLAWRQLGRGNLYVCGTPFESHWNTLPHTGSLVVLAQQMALFGSGPAQPDTAYLVAGQRWRLPAELTDDQSGQINLVSLAGDSLDWKGPPGQVPTLVRAGVYQATAAGRSYLISVRASDQEGIERYVEQAELALLGDMAHRIIPYNPAERIALQPERPPLATCNLYFPLLVLATCLLLLEGWLANPLPRRQRLDRPDRPDQPSARAPHLRRRLIASLPRLSPRGWEPEPAATGQDNAP
ncbi:MAG: BatA and WFA domain-containing protein [Sedimentisphaerales bacterium]|nr:BatA and WFA domain-containing protein [Sedimentisphaerales bacterium]